MSSSLVVALLLRVENSCPRERERGTLCKRRTLNGEDNKYEPPNRELPSVFWGREPGREDEFDATRFVDAQNRASDESDIGALKD